MLLGARYILYYFFFFNDTATTEIYTLSLHDALPISTASSPGGARTKSSWKTAPAGRRSPAAPERRRSSASTVDRKSTRLNSSHANISYAVFCLKKKKKIGRDTVLLRTSVSVCYAEES